MSDDKQVDSTNAENQHLEIHFEVCPDDCAAADIHARARLWRLAVPAWISTMYVAFVYMVPLLATMFIFTAASQNKGASASLLYVALFLYTILFIGMWLWRRFALSRMDKLFAAPDGVRCGRQRIVVANGRFQRCSDHGESWYPLETVRKVTVLSKVIVIYLDSVSYIIVPRRAFASSGDEADFLAALQKNSASRNIVDPESTKQMPRPDGNAIGKEAAIELPVKKTWPMLAVLADDLSTNIRIGIRMTFMQKVGLEELRATPAAFAVLSIFEIILFFAICVAQTGSVGHLVTNSIVYAVFPIPLMILAGLCIGELTRRPKLILALPVAYLSIAVPLDIMGALLQGVPDIEKLDLISLNGHYYSLFVWWALASLVATRRMTATVTGKGLRFAAALLLMAILLVPLWNIERRQLWRENIDPGIESEKSQVADEQFIYNQSVMLDRELARLLPGRKGIVDLYFVGFAGDGSQDVFKKEIDVIEPLFRERFDTAGRSLALINNPATVRKNPVATVTALERTLKRVGDVMNRDEDVLFLYLTSHGSREHRLSTQLSPLQLQDIDPTMLKRALDKSGIVWRVVVVSACYSGGFIEPLKNGNTMIMTASDAENSSFGCSDDSDFTWFGKALFDEELRSTFSFPIAFRQASASIVKRENNDGQDPSNPQIYVGSNIRQQLLLLESRLKALELKKKR